jgi:hypothetical protein
MHLYNADLTDAGIGTVRVFMIVALLILVIACINYVNLSTARALLRSKEISMRKIVGAAKTHLFLQFTVETGLLFILAAILALALIACLHPPVQPGIRQTTCLRSHGYAYLAGHRGHHTGDPHGVQYLPGVTPLVIRSAESFKEQGHHQRRRCPVPQNTGGRTVFRQHDPHRRYAGDQPSDELYSIERTRL